MSLGRVVFFSSTGNGGFGCPAEIVLGAAAGVAGCITASVVIAVLLVKRACEKQEKPKTVNYVSPPHV
jgi:hypothetical protein